MSKHDEYIQKISDRLVEQIKNNEAPWQKPWKAGDISDFVPVNSEGKPYRGANMLNLSSVAIAKGYNDNRWYTFYGAKQENARVKKGEKATDIHYWKFHEERNKRDENGNNVLDKDGKPVKVRVELEQPRVFYAKVFNAEQIDGLPEKKINIPIMEEWERHARCEDIIKSSGVEVINRPSDTAYYHPSHDHIVMPERSQFESPDLYYATLLHELGHSTGHPSRLNRDLTGGFGSQKYAKEELRAEISSMMMGQELQIGHNPERHVAYLASWAKAVKEDPKEIFKAVKDADAITKYVMAFEQSLEKTKEQEVVTTSRDFVSEMKQIHDEKKAINEQIPTAYEHYNKLNALAEANGYQLTVSVVDEQIINFGTHERFKIDVYESDRATEISVTLNKAGTANVSYGETDLNSAYSRKQDVSEELNRAFALDRSRDTPKLSIEDEIKQSDAAVTYEIINTLAKDLELRAVASGSDNGYQIDYYRDADKTHITTALNNDGKALTSFNNQPISGARLTDEKMMIEASIIRANDLEKSAQKEATEKTNTPFEIPAQDPSILAELNDLHSNVKADNEVYTTALETYQNLNEIAEANGYKLIVDLDFDEPSNFKAHYYTDGYKTDISTQFHRMDGKAVTSIAGERVSGTGYTADFGWQKDSLESAMVVDKAQHQQMDSEASRYSVSEFDHTRQTEWQNQLVNGVVIEDKVTDEHYVLMNIQDGIGYDPAKNLDSYDDDVIYSVAEYYSSKEAYQAQEQTKLVEQDFDILRKIGINPQSKDDDIRQFASQFPNNGDVFYKGGAPAEVVPSLTVTNIESMLGREALMLNTDEQKIIDAINEAGFSEVAKAKLEVEILDSQSQLSHTIKSDLALNDKVAVYADEINRYAGVDSDKVADAVTRLEQSFNTTLNPEDKQFDTATNQQRPFEAGNDEAELATQKTYLYVPFEEKDEAKALGAKWDKDNKAWYAPQGTDLKDFSKWRDQPEAEVSIGTNLSAEDEFSLFLQEKGVKLKSGHPKLDGRWHRLPAEDDKAGALSASYVVHTDNGIPRGYFKNFKNGEEEKWVSQQRTSEAKRPNIDLSQIKAEAEAKAKAEYDATATLADKIYSASVPADPNHGYLASKQVTADGGLMAVPANEQLPEELNDKVVIGANWREAKALRDNPEEHRIVMTQGDLLIPVQNKEGEIRTLQTIAENGFKGYLKGGEKAGNYALIGEIEANKPFLIAEGWATGKTLNEQTGQPVVVAFDKNNLVSVAETLREQYPDNRIYLASDNDHQQEAKYIAEGRTGAGGELNGGIEKAQESAEKIDAYVLTPHFEVGDTGSDWNDVYVDKGADVFKKQLRDQVVQFREEEDVKKSVASSIIKKPFTDPELARVQDKVVELAQQDPQALINEYKMMDNTFEGRYIASDMMKEVFEDFNQSSAHRNQFNNAVHNTSATLVAEHFKQMVAQPPSEDKDTVIFLTGSPASGKTSSLLNAGKLEAHVAVVYEGQLANVDNPAIIEKFEQALNAGYKVDIVAVHPNPEQALENSFKRFYDPNDGRGAPIETMAKIQGNSYEGIKAIHDKFGDKVNLIVVDKAGGNADTTKSIGWDKLEMLKSQGNKEQIKERLESHLIKHYREGSINYECLKQSIGSEERAKQIDAGLDRPVSPERHSNERGRGLQTASSIESHKLGQGHTEASGAENKTLTSATLRNIIKNSSLNNAQKEQLEVVVSAVEQRFDKHPNQQQQKYEEINNKVNEMSQTVSLASQNQELSKSKSMDR